MRTATFGVVAILLSCGVSADDSVLSGDKSNPFVSEMSAEYSANGVSTSVSELKRKFASHERASAQLAQQLRTAQKSLREDQPEVRNLRSRLQSSVAAAFGVRQQLHRAQLEELRRRMERIEQFVDSRERVRQEIIERRVEELLNPDLEWPAEPPAIDTTSNDFSATTGTIDVLPGYSGVSGTGPGVVPQAPGTVNPNADSSLMGGFFGSTAPESVSPAEPVVWIEAAFEEAVSDRKKRLATLYMNGTVIRPDGLIATVFPRGVKSSDMFKSATVFFATDSADNRHTRATLKAYDVATGAALLQADAENLPFLELSNESVSVNKELSARIAQTASSANWAAVSTDEQRTRVIEVDIDADMTVSTFHITTRSRDAFTDNEAGAALISFSGRLQGLLAPPAEDSAARSGAGDYGQKPSEYPAVSVDVIRRLVKELNQSPEHPESSERANPGRATIDSSHTSVRPNRSGASPEAVVWIETVFEAESSDGKKELVTAYLNGTVIRPDGLIATVFPDGVTSSEIFKSGNVFVGYRLHAPVSLKVHDAATGVALLQIDPTSLKSLDVAPAYLELSDQTPAINRQLIWTMADFRTSYSQPGGRDRLFQMWHDQTGVKVVGLSDDSGGVRGKFRVVIGSSKTLRDEYSGSALVTVSGRLQGLITINSPGPAAPGESEYPAVSVDVIRRLLEGLKEEPLENLLEEESKAASQRGF